MSEKFKEDIRRTIREELSNALSGNKDAAESSNSTETSQNTAISNSGTTSCQLGGGGGSSTLTFRDFYRIREASRREDFKPAKKQKRGNEALATGTKTKQLREVYFVPGTNETFSLSKYKEAISKDYKKLTFYLCLRDEFAFNQISDWSSADESEKFAGYDNQPTLTTADKKDKDKENGHEVKPTVSAATTNNPPIVVMDNDDDPLLLLALNQSQQDEGTSMPALSCSTEKNEEHLSVQVSSLDQALESKLNGISNDQYTVIEVTRKHLVESAFEQLVDEDIKGRVIVKFIGKEGVDTGGVTREFFTNYFHGLSNSGNIFRGSYPNLTFRHNLHALEEW